MKPRALPREVRIVGGAWKRSKLPVADRPGLRPTPDRVRETLFNWLGQALAGWRCLDAFAGTGALGFEAASRGAREVILLEREAALVAGLAAAKTRLNAQAVRVERADAVQWMARAPAASFELVFIDPPFDSPVFATALAAAGRLVVAGGFIYAQAPGAVDAAAAGPAFEVFRAGRAGAVFFQLSRKAAAPQVVSEPPDTHRGATPTDAFAAAPYSATKPARNVMTEARIDSFEWCMRCARRVRELDGQLSEGEAMEIAKDFSAFERTAKMEPEVAADFVHSEMSRMEPARFERRSGNRSDRTLITRYLERSAAPADGGSPS